MQWYLDDEHEAKVFDDEGLRVPRHSALLCTASTRLTVAEINMLIRRTGKIAFGSNPLDPKAAQIRSVH